MSAVYNSAKVALALGQIDWENDDIRVLLVTSSYTPDIDSHAFVDDITNELSGGEYVRKALTGLDVAQNDTDDRAELDADNVTWTALEADAGTPARVVVYKHVTNDADSPLIGYVNLTAPPAPNGGDYTIRWNNNASTAGTIFRISASA